jgi:hypothetical protein
VSQSTLHPAGDSTRLLPAQWDMGETSTAYTGSAAQECHALLYLLLPVRSTATNIQRMLTATQAVQGLALASSGAHLGRPTSTHYTY